MAEEYYAPFQEKSLHRMFSVAKSFTSLAIGLLCELPKEGTHSCYENASGVHTIVYGYQAWEKQKFPCTEFTAIASAAWQQENHFILKVYVIEEAFSHMYMELGFREEAVLLSECRIHRNRFCKDIVALWVDRVYKYKRKGSWLF